MPIKFLPRFLLPRSSHYSTVARRNPCSHRSQLKSINGRSYASGGKPRVLEKPEKFNPPSHPARRKATPRNYPGPFLSPEQQTAQKTKRYPSMMPAKGTLLHWFLTNRPIHVWISMGTLGSLAIFTFFVNFKRTTPFADMIPKGKDFLYHPFSSLSTWIEVFKLETARKTEETAERRRRKVEDVQKRSTYRKAHGLEEGGYTWTARTKEESVGPAMETSIPDASPLSNLAVHAAVDSHTSEESGSADSVIEAKPKLKKWLGIW